MHVTEHAFVLYIVHLFSIQAENLMKGTTISKQMSFDQRKTNSSGEFYC